MRQLYRGLYGIAERITGRHIGAALEELRSHDAWDTARIEFLQLMRLREILAYSKGNIPYYRNLFERCRDFDPSMIRHVSEIAQLPLLAKEDVLRDPALFWADGRWRRHLRRTGGSTGERMNVWYDDEGLDLTAAMQIRMMEWCGKKQGEPEVHFSSNTMERMPWRDWGREFCKSRALNRYNITVDLFDSVRYEGILDKIHRVRPVVVQGYPSIAYELACHAERKGRSVMGLFPVYEAEGETVQEFQRQKIETVFGCKVFNRYGSAEFGIVAHECACHDGLHIRSDMMVVETVPLEADSVLGVEGEHREIVITGLTNRGMPLIRYRTGDLGILDTTACPCGLPYPRIRQVSGRVHELIYLDGLGAVGTYVLLNTLERVNSIRNFQVAQTERGIKVLVLVDRDCRLDSLLAIQSVIWKNNRLGRYKLDIQILSHLVLSPRGKFRYVVRDPGILPDKVVLHDGVMGEISDSTGWMEGR